MHKYLFPNIKLRKFKNEVISKNISFEPQCYNVIKSVVFPLPVLLEVMIHIYTIRLH